MVEMKFGSDRILDKTIAEVSILAKLELNEEEKRNAKRDIGEMLSYVDRLNEVDTDGVEPMVYIAPTHNVLREDVVIEADGRADALLNAPEKKDGGFKVPNTIA